jgi:hypothetical protein
VEFYDQNWIEIGTKSSMRTLVQKISKISTLGDIDKACVAEKLSWASTRVTTRIEDLAYCLMGLFDVNMPLLYGEGRNAFLRLQLEIWNRTNDESIFAWSVPSLDAPSSATRSLLASELNLFEGLNSIETFGEVWERTFPGAHLLDAITLTNRGTRLDFRALEFPVIRGSRTSGHRINEFILPLKCGRKDIVQGIQLFAIHLYQNSGLNWYRDPRLQLVSIEVIKANSLKSEHVLINIPHYSRIMAQQLATAGVLFDTTPLSDYRLRVSEKFCDFPPSGSRGSRGCHWTIIDDKSVLLSFSPPTHELLAALRISAEWAEWDIILLVEYKYKFLRDGREGVASLSIQSLPRIQRLDDWIKRKPQSELSGIFVEGNDRGTCPLPDGRYISAKLKKGIHSKSRVFKVTTTISAGKEQLGSYAIAE